jgi:DNA-directed RNA polymerase specialized sigma24 family protein
MSAQRVFVRILKGVTGNLIMAQLPQLVDHRVLRPAETALALKLVTELELLRLKTLARWYARGLPPDVNWEDLLQEALTRILIGARLASEHVSTVAFVAGVMRSLRSEHVRRAAKRRTGSRSPTNSSGAEEWQTKLTEWIPGPEHALVAEQELTAIRRLFDHDPTASAIIDGLAEGLTAEEIRSAARLTETDYASARKRIRRRLLQEGLTCAPK